MGKLDPKVDVDEEAFESAVRYHYRSMHPMHDKTYDDLDPISKEEFEAVVYFTIIHYLQKVKKNLPELKPSVS